MNAFNMGGQGYPGGDSDDEEEEEVEGEEHKHDDHAHGEEPKKNADLADLDADVEEVK